MTGQEELEHIASENGLRYVEVEANGQMYRLLLPANKEGNPTVQEVVALLCRDGMKHTEIAEKLGLHRAEVTRRAIRAGIKSKIGRPKKARG